MVSEGLARRTAARIGRVGVFARQLDALTVDEARTLAREVERLGFGALWVPESLAGREAMSQCAVLLAATTRLVVATGIANVYARDPVAMANGARALADAYPGRFVLGLGTSQRAIVERRGGTYAPPAAYLRDYLRRMDEAPSTAPAPHAPYARVIAALGPRMLRIVRDSADGAHPYFVTVAHTAYARGILGPAPLLAVGQAVAVGSEREQRAAATRHIEHYLSLANYRANLTRLGWDEARLDANDAALRDALVASADALRVRERVVQHISAGADHVCLHVLATERLDDLMTALEHLRPAAE